MECRISALYYTIQIPIHQSATALIQILNQGTPADKMCSPNYLASRLLQYAGVKMSPYQSFLMDMQVHVPASNAFGYFGDDGIWHYYSEDTEYAEWFHKYRILQYYNMFDDNQ